MDQSTQHRRRQATRSEHEASIDADWVVQAEDSVLTTFTPSIRSNSGIVTPILTRTPTGPGDTDTGPVVVPITAMGSATHVPTNSPNLPVDGSTISSPATIPSTTSTTQYPSSVTVLPPAAKQGSAPQLYLIAGASAGVAFMLLVIGLAVIVRRYRKRCKQQRRQEAAIAELSTDDGCAVYEAAATVTRPEIQANVRVELEGGWHGWEASPRSPKMPCSIFDDDCDEQHTGKRSMMQTA